MTSDAHHQPVLPLDESLYRLDDAGLAFFKQQTGIDDSDELKAHLLSIQAEAYEVALFFFGLPGPYLIQSCKVQPYPCIRHFSWARYDYTMKECTIVFDVSHIPDLDSRVSFLTRTC